ncbi:Altered inheritance of mitochondria protein 36, mitochondrial [Maudiozyma exigua]|uniref:Altered inheritance of mitochondria protein 36, mitochondrial n=1 Tax=Maudiozyma exigua TaxID=34358 RepID=A0A9P6WF83_MAUEX|nr:Altered inheritance of mitochondria protein 36, mitochondrial [Kazachstania exigua]
MIRTIGRHSIKGLCQRSSFPVRSTITPARLNLSFNMKMNLTSNISYVTRGYASTAKRGNSTQEELPSFKKLILIGLAGTAVFVLAVRSLDQNKPKTSYSEEEYQQVLNGLKRKVAIFQPGEIDMQLTTLPDIKAAEKRLSKQEIQSTIFIDPKDIVDNHKNTPDDKYKALLENIYKVYANDYYYHLPQGLLVALMLDYVKENVHKDDKVVIVDFPKTIKDASNFESEIAVISKIYIPKDESEDPVCKYFETVNKVTLV